MTNGSGGGRGSRITAWLRRAPAHLFSLYAVAAAFVTYFCMYAFRKPFSAATFEGMTFLGTTVALKTSFVISQIIGYTCSKFVGIKVCSEAGRARRARMLVGCILFAEAALLLFAVLPADAKFIALFLNGLPLGMVWGLVVSYLEGRSTSELLLAGLSCSFILASGVVKDVGRALMSPTGPFAVSEEWMPLAVGGLFLLPFVASVWFLDRVPRPSRRDRALRNERAPMDGKTRRAFVREFFLGLLLLIVCYFFLTAYRDFRDNYGVEIFEALGFADEPGVFSFTEVLVSFGVMVALAALFLVKDNRLGFIGANVVMLLGLIVMGASTALLERRAIDGVTWMVLVGLGSYLAYVPFGAVLFERLFASTRAAGTAVFAIYLADSFGYTGSIAVQLGRDVFGGGTSRFDFFVGFTYALSVGGTFLVLASTVYFLRKQRELRQTRPAPVGDAAAEPAWRAAPAGTGRGRAG